MMLAFCGAGDTISSIIRSTINQMSTPDELRGRMSSINSIFTSSGPQLGQFESGLLAAWLGGAIVRIDRRSGNCRHSSARRDRLPASPAITHFASLN
jgi:MFS family permease